MDDPCRKRYGKGKSRVKPPVRLHKTISRRKRKPRKQTPVLSKVVSVIPLQGKQRETGIPHPAMHTSNMVTVFLSSRPPDTP